ncbi:thiosulfate sulfurtransferase/rhodanese-like domain-containing protein 3 [Meriones unguiculatus]|uniref:thiosulfate sulfurtransferase/rhodanese-like domain-containing protein 3 n=1 Tax=Meriones unguiculatus TaxID=10047 RepID=UPI000B4F0D60|nr:thiosulfate sulfurtransferase/rhodanese-like domain-containing protein 3 [Meriones unguiculatus]XP_021520546.1 thiosulfate sulfurtransferase/rhodanese-like domain-containing protein 3 isoform X1 [Meriones unguiculatus]
MPAGLVLGTARRAALGPLEPALGGLKAIWGSSRHFCSTLSKDVTYRELKTLLNSKDIILIDVRDTWEILEHGKIPGSINIPLDEVGEALQMSPRDFRERYHEVKPSKSDSLVFSCLAGVRSKKAMDTAISLGFSRAQHYAGGWKEWVTYEISEKKQEN